MIKLDIEQEYKIYNNELITESAFTNGKKLSFEIASFNTYDDDSVTIHFYSIKYKKHVLAHLYNGKIQYRDITNILKLETSDSLNWSSGKVDDNFLFLYLTNRAVIIQGKGLDNPIEIEISNPIPDFYINNKFSAKFRVRRYCNLSGKNGTLAVPLETGNSESKHLSFLHINKGKQAFWSSWLKETNNNFLGLKIFSKNGQNNNNTLKLNSDDFPYTHREPTFEECIIKDNKVYVQVIDSAFNSTKWGLTFSLVVEINRQGRKIDTLFEQEYSKYKNEKKYGVRGKFTSSEKYCILSSIYRSTDLWKGKQRLLSLETNKLLEIKLPRGLSSYDIKNQHNDSFWLLKRDNESTQLVRCKEH